MLDKPTEANLMESEMRQALFQAGKVQQNFMPEFTPCIAGLDVAGRNVPFDEVGGDFYEFILDANTPDAPVSIAVGDVSGHCVDSALLAARASGYLRMGGLAGMKMDDIVATMNRDLVCSLNGTGWFITLMYLTFSSDRKSVKWLRAGHPPAYLYDPSGDTFISMVGKGSVVGVDSGFVFDTNCFSNLQSGQVIVVGTDGICESANSAGEMFGYLRVQEIIRENYMKSAQKIVDEIFKAHEQFSSGMQQLDDLTLVVIKIG